MAQPEMPAQDDGNHERLEVPSMSQLRRYKFLLETITRECGGGVRTAYCNPTASSSLNSKYELAGGGEVIVPRRPSTEYMLPGSLTDWSDPDSENHTVISRDRCYSASSRGLGVAAGRLLVLEYDTRLVDDQTYQTIRNMYRFSWDDQQRVTQSEVMPIKIASTAHRVDGEVRDFRFTTIDDDGVESHDKKLLILDHEETVDMLDSEETEDSDKEHYTAHINPQGQGAQVWTKISAEDFDELHARTSAYGHDMSVDVQSDRIDVLESMFAEQ